MSTTNVKPQQLNYDHYSMTKYDQDIINSIPHHGEMHQVIKYFVIKNFNQRKDYDILDLGVGTGLTSKIIKDYLTNSELDAIDFSKKMLAGARKKLGKQKVNFILGDYSKIKFTKKYDLIISIIGIHHQNEKGKKLLFKKIYSLLKPGGIFIFGDLVTYKNPKKAAYNQALHFNHLVNKTTDKKTLAEWSYHHLFLNDLSPIENQIIWLKQAGFSTEIKMLKINTALVVCKK